VVGNRTRVKVVKNKVAAPFTEAEFDILYSCGISREGAIIEAALQRGIIEKRGSWLNFEGENLAQGTLAAIDELKSRPELAARLTELVKSTPAAVPAKSRKPAA
jgi:recombination protein RecA